MDALEDINGLMIKELVFELSPGKTCSDDLVVAEMLFQLDDDILDELAKSFRFRLLNHGTEEAEVMWVKQTLSLVKKRANAKHIADFRPIAILPVLQKLYSKMLLRLTRGKCDRLIAPQFAFRKGHQAHEVIFILRQLVEKAIEWDMGLFIMDGDVRNAYDFTKHSHVVSGLKRKGVEDVLVAAILREVRRSRTEIIVDKVTKTDEVRRTRISRPETFGSYRRRTSGDGDFRMAVIFQSYFLPTTTG